MRQPLTKISIAALLILGSIYAVETGAHVIVHPVTLALLAVAGMAVLIYGIASAESSIIGVGVLCLAAVAASCGFEGLGSRTGAIVLLAGTTLLLVEARVYPGHGACALGGVVGVFVGVYSTLGTAGGLVYALVISGLVAAMSFIALLAGIPGSSAWRELSGRLEITTGSLIQTPLGCSGAVETVDQGTVSIRTIAEGDQPDTGKSRIGPQTASVETLKKRMEKLKSASIPVIANAIRTERELTALRDRESRIEAEARSAVAQGRDDLAVKILIQREKCREEITLLEKRLELARESAESARHNIDHFRDELRIAESRSRDAQVRRHLAGMIEQAWSLVAQDMDSLRRIEEMADAACSEAEAFASMEKARVTEELDARKKRASRALTDLKAELRRKPLEENGRTLGLDRSGYDPEN